MPLIRSHRARLDAPRRRGLVVRNQRPEPPGQVARPPRLLNLLVLMVPQLRQQPDVRQRARRVPPRIVRPRRVLDPHHAARVQPPPVRSPRHLPAGPVNRPRVVRGVCADRRGGRRRSAERLHQRRHRAPRRQRGAQPRGLPRDLTEPVENLGAGRRRSSRVNRRRHRRHGVVLHEPRLNLPRLVTHPPGDGLDRGELEAGR
mmetsp:Transcript_10848/g.50020  ORF Transcript_10848/g.50020 Transcript_10848/m.50020 type:complete len:202 (-) Transcript_10848:3112-3717(-)